MSNRTPDLDRLEGIAERFEGVTWKAGGFGFLALCPAHDDTNPSLSVDVGDEQPLLLYCHAGCEPDDILDAAGVAWADVMRPDPAPTYTGPVSARTGWTAAELLSVTLPEPRWAVPGLLPVGLLVLAGAPKVGKSWLLLDLCLRVAMGSKVLGTCPVEPGPTLYLALEDTPRRLQERARRLLGEESAPATAHLHTAWPRMGQGGADKLRDHLAAHSDTRLVAVDVLSRVRDVANGDRGQYDADYEAMTAFKRLADDFDVSLVINHHDRKAKDADWLTTVSGTRGVTGAADAVMLLTKPRGEADGLLSITGRDVEENRHALRFDAGQWVRLDGPIEAYTVSATRARILETLTATPSLLPVEVADRLDGVSRENVRQTLARMAEDGQVVADSQRRYRLPDPQTPVTGVTESQMPAQPVTRDGCDSVSGVTRSPRRARNREGKRRSDSEPVTLRSVTGCEVEEWLARVGDGFPEGLRAEAMDALADQCAECDADRGTLPQAIVSNGSTLNAYYLCRAAHAWAATFCDLNVFWQAT